MPAPPLHLRFFFFFPVLCLNPSAATPGRRHRGSDASHREMKAPVIPLRVLLWYSSSNTNDRRRIYRVHRFALIP